MKIVLIHGQNHKGSTYHIAECLVQKLDGEVKEFFLPRDFDKFCVGCSSCFMKGETKCPHYQELLPIVQAMDEADLLILTSPVYVYHVTGSMKAFLDHFGYRWMVHRPHESMFRKQAVCISTAAGSGMKNTNKDMEDSLYFWGVGKIYKIGLAVNAIKWQEVPDKKKAKIDKITTKVAKQIKKKEGHVRPGIKTKAFFKLMSIVQKKGFNETDKAYWLEKGCTTGNRPWK